MLERAFVMLPESFCGGAPGLGLGLSLCICASVHLCICAWCTEELGSLTFPSAGGTYHRACSAFDKAPWPQYELQGSHATHTPVLCLQPLVANTVHPVIIRNGPMPPSHGVSIKTPAGCHKSHPLCCTARPSLRSSHRYLHRDLVSPISRYDI